MFQKKGGQMAGKRQLPDAFSRANSQPVHQANVLASNFKRLARHMSLAIVSPIRCRAGHLSAICHQIKYFVFGVVQSSISFDLRTIQRLLQ